MKIKVIEFFGYEENEDVRRDDGLLLVDCEFNKLLLQNGYYECEKVLLPKELMMDGANPYFVYQKN